MALTVLVTLVTSAAFAEPPPTPERPDDPMLAPAPRPPRQVETWDEAHQQLRQRSTDLRTAEAGLIRAEALWRQALSTLLPNVAGSLAVSGDLLEPASPRLPGGAFVGGLGDEAPTAPLGSATISLRQTLVDVEAWRGLDTAAAIERGAQARLHDIRRRISQGLARALVAVVAAERTAEINRLGLRHALERAALTRKVVELGRANQLDLARVEQDVAVARTALIAGDEQLRRTREALGLALGLAEEVGVAEDFALEGLVSEMQAHCSPLEPSEPRSDLEAADAEAEAARHLRRQAVAGYYPTLDLTTNLLAITTDPGPLSVPTWSIAAVISIPLWEGGYRDGLVDERAALEEQALQEEERLRRSVTVEIAQARRAEEVALGLLRAATEARRLALRTDALTRRAVEIGRAGSLELVQTAIALREAELTLALRELEWVQARIDAFLTEARCP